MNQLYFLSMYTMPNTWLELSIIGRACINLTHSIILMECWHIWLCCWGRTLLPWFNDGLLTLVTQISAGYFALNLISSSTCNIIFLFKAVLFKDILQFCCEDLYYFLHALPLNLSNSYMICLIKNTLFNTRKIRRTCNISHPYGPD